MTQTAKFIAAGAILAAAVIVAWLARAADLPAPGSAGRFATVSARVEAFVGEGANTQLHEFPTAILLDTATGRAWYLKLGATTNGLRGDWLPIAGGPQ